ncbi:MAG: response regulator [Candidatus Rokuibacteriota bacterium]
MSASGLRPRILVVDDESVIAQLIADVLSSEGYDVDTAPHGLAALEEIGRHAYDLILSDLRMPELDGLGLYRELQQRRPELVRRFVFITGTSEHTDYQDFIDDVTAPVLTKPFDVMELQRVVREMLPAASH